MVDMYYTSTSSSVLSAIAATISWCLCGGLRRRHAGEDRAGQRIWLSWDPHPDDSGARICRSNPRFALEHSDDLLDQHRRSGGKENHASISGRRAHASRGPDPAVTSLRASSLRLPGV